MIRPFSLEVPRTILFGCGQRKSIPELLAPYGARVLLVSGSRWLKDSGRLAQLMGLLPRLQVLTLSCPGGEPTSEGLEELLAEARGYRPQAVLAVGGGSVLDTAKAVSALLPLSERVDDFLEGGGAGLRVQKPGLPWIAVPTTAGTGAEVTQNAVIRSLARGVKRSIRSPHLLAAAVVVDPELTLDCPLSLSGMAGLDALAQQIESFVSRKARPVPRALVRDAFPLLLRCLQAIPERPGDLEARGGASYGAMISGIALANSGLGAAHGLASGLGGMYDIPHGLICALALRPVLRLNAPLIGPDIELLVREARQEQAGRGEAVEWLEAKIGELLQRYRLPADLKGFGIDADLAEEIARRSSGSSMSGNPRELSLEERKDLLLSLL